MQFFETGLPSWRAADRTRGHRTASRTRTRCESRKKTPGTVSAFETWSYESELAIDVDALREMVKRQLPASVYRCKGIIFSGEDADRRVVLQVVGRRVQIEPEGEWGDRPRKTRIVAIGERGHLDRDWLRDAFDACLVTRP